MATKSISGMVTKSVKPARGATEIHSMGVTFCCVLNNGIQVVYQEAKAPHEGLWETPCYLVEFTDDKNNPAIFFSPLNKFGVSSVCQPIPSEHILMTYTAGPKLEESFSDFVRKNKERIARDFDA